MIHLIGTLKAVCSEILKMARKAADPISFMRYSADLFLLRLKPSNRERLIRLQGDISFTYRLNRGDMQSIREVWLDEAYRLPFTPCSVLIDLGGNIGLASLWLAKKYGYSAVILVEPSPDNAHLARVNLNNNHIHAEVVEAAVGPTDGTAFFEESAMSNMGHVADEGKQVVMVSMATLLARSPHTPVDLKMDIEGGEDVLLQGDLAWLNHVNGIIAEFHPEVIDYPRAITTIERAGFKYIPAGTAHKDSMDSFVKTV